METLEALPKSASAFICLSKYMSNVRTVSLVVLIVNNYSLSQLHDDYYNRYEDFIMLVAMQIIKRYPAKTYPSMYRKRFWQLPSSDMFRKGMFTLVYRIWHAYKIVFNYNDFISHCQLARSVSLTRNVNPPYHDSGYVGNNIACGGLKTTGSK